MKLKFLIPFLPCALVLSCIAMVQAETVEIRDRQFVIPDGFELKLAIEPGITERPIVVDFDSDGHLYVAESSGTNDNVQKQLADKPHSILRLSDTNQDGVFDQRTVFADRMMFPAGVLCHQGSVYVSAPPEIWKLTDTDDDGVADEREVWFDAKTLTGCANDLHGPYLGVDGWIYWCKGAFAEQSYERPVGKSFVTHAAHVFRRRPKGGLVEPVMTGGMDNPVEVAFTATGERFFTTTFFQHPANGQRDGLVHAIYGGVYGKSHGVIDGHPRTGDLMPVMTHLGAAAPSGLTRLESNTLGFLDQLLTACFNLHSITRHELIQDGASFKTKDVDLVSTNDLDFHPTDVIEDADGSVLIIDTGGWYKLCCPTSQLHKPDIPGAIYRLTKRGAKRMAAPRGLNIDWKTSTVEQLAKLLEDNRFAVRKRAIEELSMRGSEAVPAILGKYQDSCVTTGRVAERASINSVWAACRIDSPKAREVVRLGLRHKLPNVRQAAVHAVSVWRDAKAGDRLIELLSDDSSQVRRAAAEAIGRIDVKTAIPHLLERLNEDVDRVQQHSLIYALIELNAPELLRPVLASGTGKQKRAALTAIRGIGGDQLSKADLLKLLPSSDAKLRALATSIAAEHADWSGEFAELYRHEIEKAPGRLGDFVPGICALAEHPAMGDCVAELLTTRAITTKDRLALLNQVPFSNGGIATTFERLLQSNDSSVVAALVRKLANSKKLRPGLVSQLTRIAKSTETDTEIRLMAARQTKQLDNELFKDVVGFLSGNQSARVRSLAVGVLENAELRESQLLQVAGSLSTVGAFELSRLLRVFKVTKSKDVGVRIMQSLGESPAAESLPAEQIRSLAKQFGSDVIELAGPLIAASSSLDPLQQSQQLADKLDVIPKGDIRRGQKLFHDQKLACFTCHAVGYRGGTVGPDLSRIGKTRSRRDLLEAIIYPSASFVRSYEPINVVMDDGRQLSGIIRNQSADEVELQLNATETRKLASAEIEEMLPGKVSVMPSGLDKQLTDEQLADLLAFLESRK